MFPSGATSPSDAMSGAAGIVDEIGVTGALASVVLVLVGALLYLVYGARKQIADAADHAAEASKQAKQANAAVNNVGPGEHRMYDKIEMIRADVEQLVAEQRDFVRRGWQSLPDDLATSAALTSTVRELQHNDTRISHSLGDLSAAVAQIDSKLTKHVEWEESQKYLVARAEDGGFMHRRRDDVQGDG